MAVIEEIEGEAPLTKEEMAKLFEVRSFWKFCSIRTFSPGIYCIVILAY
jgi:hypothetical protein